MNTWLVFPARHTVAFEAKNIPEVRGSAEAFADAEANGEGQQELSSKTIMNLSCGVLQDDYKLDEPELPFQLKDENINELNDPRAVSATYFGVLKQDKASNEDFALSAIINTPRGTGYGFVSVADGVGTRTFWAGRTARIACFGTYLAVREELIKGLSFDGDGVENLKLAIGHKIRNLLLRDEERLRKYGTVPIGWDRNIFEKYGNRRDMWYRSTLLFGLVGPKGGIIGLAGDGGIRALVNSEPEGQLVERCILRSQDGVDLNSYVSLDFSSAEIAAKSFSHPEQLSSDYIFTSDGLDKTLQAFIPDEYLEKGGKCKSRYRDLPLSDRQQAFALLEEISGHECADFDNLSVARLSWPLQSFHRPLGKTKSWPSWKQAPLTKWPSAQTGKAEPRPLSNSVTGLPSKEGEQKVKPGAKARSPRTGAGRSANRYKRAYLVSFVIVLVTFILIALPPAGKRTKSPFISQWQLGQEIQKYSDFGSKVPLPVPPQRGDIGALIKRIESTAARKPGREHPSPCSKTETVLKPSLTNTQLRLRCRQY